MKTRWLSKCLGASLSGFIAFLSAPTRADTPWSFTGTRGWQFRHGPDSPPNDLLITQLGVFDEGGDGLVNSHEIGLWSVQAVQNTFSGTLLASATVPAGTTAPLIGGYRWVGISPILVPYASGPLAVAAQCGEFDADALVTPRPTGTLGNYEFAPDITPYLVAGRVGFGSGLPFPAYFTGAPCEGCPSPLFFEPNFQYAVVPEPSFWLVLLSSLLFLRLRRHG